MTCTLTVKHGTRPCCCSCCCCCCWCITHVCHKIDHTNQYKDRLPAYSRFKQQEAVSSEIKGVSAIIYSSACVAATQAPLTMIELWVSSSHTTASSRCGRHDISPRFASYPELKRSAAWRRWKRAIHLSSSSAYLEFPASSLDPPEPTSGKVLLLLLLLMLLMLFGCCKPSLSLAVERVPQSLPTRSGPCRGPARRSAVSCAECCERTCSVYAAAVWQHVERGKKITLGMYYPDKATTQQYSSNHFRAQNMALTFLCDGGGRTDGVPSCRLVS